MYVPFASLRPSRRVWNQLDNAYWRVIQSGQYIGGREVTEFEEAWANYIGTKYCVAVGSGTLALRYLLTKEFTGGSAIWVPRNSRPTIEALQEGNTLILEDVDETHNIKPCEGIVVVAVHLYGNPANLHGVKAGYLVEDACQAHGAEWRGRKCGSIGDAAAWSFYPTKNLGAYGDAGAITTNREDVAKMVRSIRTARMDPLQAAFLNVKLTYLDSWNARRREIAEQYLEGLEGVGLPIENGKSSWHLFVITHPERDRIRKELEACGIQTMVHYPPTPKVLSLPCHPRLTDEQVRFVIGEVNRLA